MKVFHYSRSLSGYLESGKKRIGFVPTMGALHDGHLALVRASREMCEVTVVSIFVNPRQFNKPEDLIKYPRTLVSDLAKLKEAGADVVFIPDETQVYTGESAPELALTPLDKVFEGEFRPGHFRGVVEVLYRFFRIVRPQEVFFGLKDLQQCLVVEKLIASQFPSIHQHNMPTLRETSGLAMSSRNARLSPEGWQKASGIYKELTRLSQWAATFEAEKQRSIQVLKDAGIETEYLELAELPDMVKADPAHLPERTAIVFAGYLEGVRLIDNVLL